MWLAVAYGCLRRKEAYQMRIQEALIAFAVLAWCSGCIADHAFARETVGAFGRANPVADNRSVAMSDKREDADAPHNGACWQYREEAGRWKRTYICD
jgi:hypothetical protein